jgi:hypothetical protein
MHWGRETQTDLSDFQLTNSDAITKSGVIDLVVGTMGIINKTG